MKKEGVVCDLLHM